MLDIIAVYLASIFIFNICIFLGLSLQRSISTASKNQNYYDEYWISPILGLTILMFKGILIGYFFGYKSYLTIFLFILASILSIYLIYKNLSLKKLKELNFLFLILSIIPLGTLLIYGGYNSYNDAWTYISQAQWLQDNPFSKKTDMSGFYPMQSQITLYQNMGSRMGASYLLGYFQSILLFNWSYYPYLCCLTVIFVSTVCTLISYFIKKFDNIINVSLACSFLIISQNGFVSSGNYGFFPQAFGLTFLIATILFILISLEELKNNKKNTKNNIFILSIFFSGLLFTYNDIVPIISLCLIIFIILETKLDVEFIKKIIPTFFLFLIFVILLVNFEFLRIIENYISGVKNVGSGSVKIGWPVFWDPIQFFAYSFGLKSILNINLNSLEKIISTYGFFIFFLMNFFLIKKFKLFKNDNYKSFFNIFFSFNIIFLILFLKFRYFDEGFVENEIGNSFLQFKLYGWLSVINISFLIYTYLLVYDCLEFRFKKAIFILISVLFFFGIYLHGFFSPKFSMQEVVNDLDGKKYPLREYLILREKILKNVNKDEIIYLSFGAEKYKLRKMIAYILNDYKIISNYMDDGYITGNILPKDRNISPVKSDFLLIFDKGEKISENYQDSVFTYNSITLLRMPKKTNEKKILIQNLGIKK